MSQDWKQFEGAEVEGWPLNSLLGERDGRAFFVTVNDAKSLLLQLLPAEDPPTVAAIQSLESARDLSHENLLSVYGFGNANVNGVPFSFAVFDLPDDDLGEMLGRGDLSQSEGRRIVSSIQNAVAYLHQHGFCHSSLSPSTVLMVGGVVKLSVDTLAPAGPEEKLADLRRLGELRELILGGTIAKTAAANEPESRASWGRMTAVASFVVLAFVLYWSSDRHGSAPNSTPAPVTVSEAHRELPVIENKPEPFAPPRAASVTGGSERPRDRSNPWAVVAATYAYHDAAEKRADQIHQRWPQLQPHVFPGEGKGKNYFVVLRSGLTRDQADQLRRTAVDLGVPTDTYVTKLEEQHE